MPHRQCHPQRHHLLPAGPRPWLGVIRRTASGGPARSKGGSGLVIALIVGAFVLVVVVVAVIVVIVLKPLGA